MAVRTYRPAFCSIHPPISSRVSALIKVAASQLPRSARESALAGSCPNNANTWRDVASGGGGRTGEGARRRGGRAAAGARWLGPIIESGGTSKSGGIACGEDGSDVEIDGADEADEADDDDDDDDVVDEGAAVAAWSMRCMRFTQSLGGNDRDVTKAGANSSRISATESTSFAPCLINVWHPRDCGA